jgi:glycosyltransferase involved in cell wall biosynthesis
MAATIRTAAAGQRIVMLGTGFQTMGGISAVVNEYRHAGLFERFPVLYLPTHVDGSNRAKMHAVMVAWMRYMLLLLCGRIALIHVHIASDASFWRKCLFIYPAMLLRVPSILHLHGAEFNRFYEKDCGAVTKAIVRHVLDHVDTVIVLSTQWRKWVSGISRNPRIVAIRNPVRVGPAHDFALREPATILFLGRLGQRKGTWDLLAAVARIAADHPRLRLCLGGDGEIAMARREARRLGLDVVVETPGWLGPQEKADRLARATVYVLPSYSEGLPMSVLEAMSAGLPVVTTPVGGLTDVVEDGKQGLLVEPGNVAQLADALDRLLCDPALRLRLGAAARAQAEAMFSVQQVVPRIEQLYVEFGVVA